MLITTRLTAMGKKHLLIFLIFLFILNTSLLYGVDKMTANDKNPCLLLTFKEGTGLPLDTSGNNNNPTENTAKWEKDAKKGWVLKFGAAGSCVNIPNSTDLQGLNGITIEIAVKWEDLSFDSWGLLIDKRDWKNPQGGYFLAIDDARKVLLGINGPGLGMHYIVSDACVKEKDWSYITAAFRPGTLEVSVDGVTKKLAIPSDSVGITEAPMVIGKEQEPGLLHLFNGQIDYIKISTLNMSKNEAKNGNMEKSQNEIKKTKEARKSTANTNDYILWGKNPLEQFCINSNVPEKTEELKELNVSACINEYEPASFVLSNLSGNTIRGRVIFDELINEKGDIFPIDNIDVRLPCFVTALDPHISRSSKNRVPVIIADALPLASESNEFIIPPKQGQEIFFEINTKNAIPGNYRGHVFIKPYYSAKEKVLDLNLKIHPIQLAKSAPFDVYVFSEFIDRGFVDSAYLDEYLKDLRAHYVNVVHVEKLPYPLLDKSGNVKEILSKCELENFNNTLKKEKAHGFDKLNIALYFFWGGKRKSLGGTSLKYMTPEWKHVASLWLKALIKDVREMGFEYDQFAFYAYDEIRETEEKAYLEFAKWIKEVDPNARIFLTYAWGSSCSVINNTSGITDIACMRLPPPRLQQKDWGYPFAPIRWDACKKARKLWGYNTWCAKFWHPWEIRKHVWNTWRYKLSGISFWTYMSHHKNPWDDNSDTWLYEGLVYADNFTRKPVPSRRWEAFRQGIEDCLYLYKLEEVMIDAEKNNINIDKAKKIIRQFNEQMFYGHENWDEFKDKVIKEIIYLTEIQKSTSQENLNKKKLLENITPK